MKRIALLLVFVLLLFACSLSKKRYDEKLTRWVGQSEMSLEKAWGRPTKEKQISADTKILTYIQKGYNYVPMEYFYDNPGWGADDIVYDPFFGEYEMSPFDEVIDTEVEEICQTSFVVTKGKIVSYKWRGNACD